MRRNKSFLPLLFLFLAALLLPGAHPVQAQTEGLVITVEAGLDGYCKVGAWMPVRVTISNNSEDITGVLFAETWSGAVVWEFGAEVSIPAVSRKEWTLYVYPVERDPELLIGIRSGSDVIAQQAAAIDCVDKETLLLGVWAANPSVFNSQTAIRTVLPRPALVQLDETDLPDRPIGLAMLDTLTISDVDTGVLTAAQLSALTAWIADGGRLFIAGGPGWQKTAAGLESLLPLQPSGDQTLDGLDAIARLAGRSDAPGGTAVAAAGELLAGSEVIAAQGELPVIVAGRHGFGEVVYLAVDPALEPLRTWIGMEDFYTVLLGRIPDRPSWHDGFKAWNEAELAMNAIPGLGLPSAWLVCGFILCYIGIVGPVNFFVLRKLKKRELAWVTVPALVLCFAGVIFVFGTNLIGSSPIVNRLAIIQAWPGEQTARVDGLIGIFSPGRGQYTLGMESGFSAHPIPQQVFSPDFEREALLQTDAGFRVPDVQIGTGGLEGYAVSGRMPAPQINHDLRIEWLPGGSRRLTGEIENASQLRLTDVLVLTGAGSLKIGDFSPGDTTPVSLVYGAGGATPLGPIPSTTYGGPGIYDDTLNQVFGTNYVFSTAAADLELYRRFNLFAAAYNQLAGTRGGGVYLLGWTDEAPFNTDLGEALERNSDTTLYIIQLTPGVLTDIPAADEYRLTPDMFSWQIYGGFTGSVLAAPYDGFVQSGYYALSFIPTVPLAFDEVATLTLHLKSYGASGPVPLEVELWDFEESVWVDQEGLIWGENEILSPDRFVGAYGEIRIRLTNAGSGRVDIEQSDFTLEVEP